MKPTSLLFVCLFAGTVASDAGVVFEDHFDRYTDGTTLNGQTPVAGSGTWTGGGGWKVNDHAVSLVGYSDTVYGYFTSPLAAGQKLTLTFDTQAIDGFLDASWAVVSLYDSLGHETYIGDPGDPTSPDWIVGGNIAYKQTADTNQANTATFTYEFDTGKWTFSTNGGSYNGTGPAGYALDYLRIGAGGQSDYAGKGVAGNMKLTGIKVSIEPVVVPELKVTAFTRVNATTYQLEWSGGDGTNDVEASTDLVGWTQILYNVASPITVDTGGQPTRFFRVVEPATP